MSFLVFQRLVIEFFLDLFYFPLWWYSAGAKKTVFSLARLFADGNRQLAPGLWLKNIFVPMFGQRDIQGRLVSFVVRLANVVFRGIALVFWLLIVIALFFVWVATPVLIFWMLLLALFPG